MEASVWYARTDSEPLGSQSPSGIAVPSRLACAREAEQRRAGEDEREHRPLRHAVAPLPPRLGPAPFARRPLAPDPQGVDARAEHGKDRGKQRDGQQEREHRHQQPREADRAQLGEGDHEQRGKADRNGEGREQDRPACAPRGLLGGGAGGLSPREGLAKAAHGQQGVVDAEPEADHRGQALDQDGDGEVAREKGGDAERERDREDAHAERQHRGDDAAEGEQQQDQRQGQDARLGVARVGGAGDPEIEIERHFPRPAEPHLRIGGLQPGRQGLRRLAQARKQALDRVLSGVEATTIRKPPSLPAKIGSRVSREDSVPATPGTSRTAGRSLERLASLPAWSGRAGPRPRAGRGR